MPVFQQIVGKIICIINLEQLKSGVRLPTIRELAGRLGVNPNTVVRAYEELEVAGIITKKRGSGCVVGTGSVAADSEIIETALDSRIEELFSTAGAMGVRPDAVIQRVESRADAWVCAPIQKLSVEESQTLNKSESSGEAIWQPDEEGFID